MRKVTVLFVGAILLVLLGLSWWSNNLKPVNPRDNSEKMFVIAQGSGTRQISRDLKKEGLIKDENVFFFYLRQGGFEKKIQAGDFRLSPSMSADKIAKTLTEGSIDVWVTIPEGKRAEEIAEILEAKVASYEPSWEAELVKHEGRLFPDTYLVPRDSTIESIITLLTNTFEARYETVTNKTSYSKNDVVTIASLIEREARHDEDRPIISSVIHNRLDIGMALQIDASIQYAKGYKGAWWKPVTLAEYKSVKSDYNTYLFAGLPPGPIANPGLEALQAAGNPASTDYIYYITDQNGINRYAKTLDQHEANKAKYGL
ncbi:MAG: endolytic transglycosylase MltG [Candidatus Levybacteria bacterium]|nr:endolytic transglycosylase MltG [Candidatus Levybacteria bacterium]